MKLILEIETDKDLKIKDFAKLERVLRFLGLKLKKFSSVKNYKQRIINGVSDNNIYGSDNVCGGYKAFRLNYLS